MGIRYLTHGLILLFIVAIHPVSLLGQSPEIKSDKSWQMGAFAGVSQYFGDVSNKTYFEKLSGESKFSFGLLARKHLNEKIGLGLSFSRSSLFSQKENTSTAIPIFLEYSGHSNQYVFHSYLNLSNIFYGYADRKAYIYGTIGIGYASWDGALTNYQTNTVITDFATAVSQNYALGAPMIPIALGIEFPLSPSLRFNIESSLTTLLSDDIDYYKDGYQYDFLAHTHIGLNYYFGVSQPKTRKPARYRPTLTHWEPSGQVTVVDYERFPLTPVEKAPKIELPPLKLPETQVEATPQAKPGFEFRVQIYAKRQPVSSPSVIYRHINFEYPVVENYFNGIYRYSTGSFRTYSEAESYARNLQSRGVYDAFVVAYENNVRVTITPEMKR